MLREGGAFTPYGFGIKSVQTPMAPGQKFFARFFLKKRILPL
jgi:hypothetical protein